MSLDTFATRTLAAIGRDAFREDAGDPVALDQTSWAVSRLTVEALERLNVFLLDIASRAPLAGPAWYAHREVIEALSADIGQEIVRRG